MFKVEIKFTFNVSIVILFISLNQYLLQWSIIGFDYINKDFFFLMLKKYFLFCCGLVYTVREILFSIKVS